MSIKKYFYESNLWRLQVCYQFKRCASGYGGHYEYLSFDFYSKILGIAKDVRCKVRNLPSYYYKEKIEPLFFIETDFPKLWDCSTVEVIIEYGKFPLKKVINFDFQKYFGMTEEELTSEYQLKNRKLNYYHKDIVYIINK